VSPLPSPVEPPEGFDPEEFMVNIGLALKELRTETPDANFSIVNFNALPEVYVPPRFSVVRVLVPIGIIIGIGLIVLGVILIQQNRAGMELLRTQLTVTETAVTQQQRQIATLKARIEPMKVTADELNSRVVTMERQRATIHEDLAQIVKLASGKVTLGSVNHALSSVSVSGSASNENDIFSYARALRSGGRFSQVWISSIAEGEGGLTFALSLTK